MGVWIGVIVITPSTESKINEKHQVTFDEVRQAVLAGAATEARWHQHEVYGRRLLARGETAAGRQLIVTLVPTDREEETWECKTARPWTGR
jgi:uncharacterized DUF497 family protein